jgi:hypothetical protein
MSVNVRDRRAAMLIYLAPAMFLARARGKTIAKVTMMHCKILKTVGCPPLTKPVTSGFTPNFWQTNTNSCVTIYSFRSYKI